MSRAARRYLWVALAGGLLLTACSLFKAERSPQQTSQGTGVGPAARRISQVDFGQRAHYAGCVEPACPAVTAKTLASAPAPIETTQVGAAPPGRPVSSVSTPKLATPAATSLQPAAPRKLVLHFGTNSAVLTASHKALLGNAIRELRQADRIVIAGRTDDLGSEPLNEALALARALAIRDHMLDLAPDLPARIAIDAKGRCCYTAPNDSMAGRAQNRRVELAYTPRDEGAP